MALNKITYDNKVALDPQPSVANINKCTADDLNEIKSIVNNAIDQVDTNTSDIGDIQEDITTINGKLTDSGWIDMSSYLNTTYFSVRPGYSPMVRKIGKVCYWKGNVYCSTNVGGNQAYLFTNLPSTYAPNYEHAGCGVHFPTNNTYKIFFDGNGGIVVNEGNNNINASLEYEGFTLSDLGSYIID